MGTKDSYGALTDAQLSEFLDELNCLDNDFEDDEQQAVADSKEAEERDEPVSSASVRQRSKDTRKKEIQRFAFSQDLVQLADKVTEADTKYLIRVLTDDITASLSRYEDYINTRLTKLLRPLIPPMLVKSLNNFPNSVVGHPGFLYRTGKDNKGLVFWAKPKVPYFLTQGAEKGMIAASNSGVLENVDKAVERYHKAAERRDQKQLKIATLFVGGTINTYFDLLKYNPMWFELIYNKRKNDA